MAKDRCVFCDIVAGKEKAWRVYEDEKCLAILDAFPVNEGHILVLPKKHVQDIFELDEDLFLHLCRIARKLGRAMLKPLGANFANIVTASSLIKHAFIHVIPRYDYDLMGLLPDMENKRKLSDEEMEIIYRKIRGVLDGSGKKTRGKTG